MAAYKAVLFDLDGTLLDSKPLILKSFRGSWQACRKSEPPLERFRSLIGLPLETMMKTILKEQGEHGPEASESAKCLLEGYRSQLLLYERQMLKPFDGALELLRELKDEGLPLGLVTSKLRAVTERHLLLVGFDVLLDTVVCADDTLEHKPHPKPFLTAASNLGVRPRDCLAVGDSPADLLSARAAGMRFCAATWGADPVEVLLQEGPDYAPGTPLDILEIIRSVTC